MKKYQIIYADPPWEYKNKREFINKTAGAVSVTKMGRLDYPQMTIEQIKELPIKDLADKNCALFLWTTTPYLEKSFEVINSWGFEYKTIGFIWLKTWGNEKSLEYYMTTHYGMNYYTKLQFEICLLGIKNSMTPISHKVSGQIIAPRGKHSKKPAIVREKIKELFGDLPRIELFARKEDLLFDADGFEGWDVWGNEVKSDINLEKL